MNADGYGGEVGELLTHNVYAYCANNPTSQYDPTGNFAIAITAAITTAITYAIEAAVATAATAVTALATAKVIDAVEDRTVVKEKVDPITKKPPKATQYWLADNKAISKEPLTYSQAKIAIATGQNVMCINQLAALALVKTYPKRVIDKAHHGGADGYYSHYHLNDTTSYPHIWFEGPIILEQGRVR